MFSRILLAKERGGYIGDWTGNIGGWLVSTLLYLPSRKIELGSISSGLLKKFKDP
jgi:hypothetical protein